MFLKKVHVSIECAPAGTTTRTGQGTVKSILSGWLIGAAPLLYANQWRIRMTDVSKLVPFTGYYSMNAAPGAFLSIDTIEERSISPIQPNTTISINVSMDGKSATTYPFGGGATFDGVRLSIPGKLTLDFTREYRNGHLVTFSGTIGGVNAKGETYYNPVPLSAFIGDYYDVQTSKMALSIKSDLEILFDYSIFSSSGQLQQVDSYKYVPAMFVLTFSGRSSSEPASFTLMLGTASKNGLACSIQGGGTPRFAVSILPFIP